MLLCLQHEDFPSDRLVRHHAPSAGFDGLRGRGELRKEGVRRAEVFPDCPGQLAAERRAARNHAVPVDGVQNVPRTVESEVTAQVLHGAVVAGPPGFGQLLKGCVQAVDVSLVVLAVVQRQRLPAQEGLQGVLGVGQGRPGVLPSLACGPRDGHYPRARCRAGRAHADRCCDRADADSLQKATPVQAAIHLASPLVERQVAVRPQAPRWPRMRPRYPA